MLMKKNRIIKNILLMTMLCSLLLGCGKRQGEIFDVPIFNSITFDSAMTQKDVKAELDNSDIKNTELSEGIGADANWLDHDGVAMFTFDNDSKLLSIQWVCEYSPEDMDVYVSVINYLNDSYGEMSKTNDENIYAWKNGTVLFVLGDDSCSVQWYRSDWRDN